MLRSLFQMPVPQGKDGVRPTALCAACPQPLIVVSAAGVLGWEAVGDMVLLAKEPLRGCGSVVCDVLFNHEARRTGFC